MQQKFFNASFMSPPVQDKITYFSVIYGERPLYFASTSGTDIKKQLALFRNSSNFSFFQIQYETLLDNLKTWCDRHECEVLLDDELIDDALIDDEKTPPAFALLKKYLFGVNNYFGNSEATFFNEGKKSLEELWLLLENEHIPLDGKHKVLMELQTGLRVCADGILTNIRNATNELKAYTGINETLQQIKTEFIQQHAIPTIQSLFGDTEDYESFEIHYVNAYYNQVAKDFGLAEQYDSYISTAERDITLSNLRHFKNLLQEQFTPNRMLVLLLVKLRGDWSALHAELSEKLRALRTNWHTIENAELSQIMGEGALFAQEQILFTNALEQWNKKYGALIKLNFYDLADVDDNSLIVIHDLSTLNKILEPQIIKKFSEQYLEPNHQFSLQIEANFILCSHHGLLWCERKKIPEFIALEHVKKINPERLSAEEQVHYCFVLEQLFEQFPEERVELSHMLHSLDKQLLDLIWDQGLIHCLLNLDSTQQGRLLNHYAQENQPGVQKLITLYPEKLLRHLCALDPDDKTSFDPLFNVHCHYEGIGKTTLFGYAVHTQNWRLINDLVLSSWFTAGLLLAPIHYKNHRDVNVLWIIVAEQRWELLDDLIELNLVTSTQLSSPLNEEKNAKELNVLYLLGRDQQWDLLEKLFKQEELITAELLAPTILTGAHRGINLLWILANNQQWDLIDLLVQQDLIGSPMLAAMPHEDTNRGRNVLYLLGLHERWDLLENLFEQEHLITAELLAPTALEGVHRGINLLWILVYKQQWDLIDLLVQQYLIGSLMLAAMPLDGAYRGANVLYLLGLYKQWELLENLFEQEHLITAELLVPTVLEGVTRGTNLLWILANNQQWDLINLLLQKQLIRPPMLAAMPIEGECQGINALYLFGYYKRWDVIKELLSQKIITTELLAPITQEGENQGTEVLTLLIDSEQWALIGTLLQQNLLTEEQQRIIPEERNLLSTPPQYTPAFFNVADNNELKRKTMDEEDKRSDESNLKKHKH